MTSGGGMRVTYRKQVLSACRTSTLFILAGSLFPGCALWEILAAGEWSSPAFLAYLDLHQLESDLVLQSHMDESDVDDDT